MYKKILVPTDASDFSMRAFKTAVELAKCFQAEIVLIHVALTPQNLFGYTVTYSYAISQEDIIKGGNLVLDTTIAEVPTEGVVTKTVLEIGYPAVKILEQIEKDDIDLVVIGSQGHGPLAGSVLGSVSQRILQKSHVPVLLVK